MSDKIKVILIITLIVLGLGGFIAYDTYKDYLHPNPEGTIGNTAGNLNNGGFFCQSGDKVYFANAYDENRLYVMNADETGMKCLTDSPVSYINVDRSNIYYYINNLSSVSGLGGFKISTYGLFATGIKSEKTKCVEKVNCGIIQIVDNNLLYQRYDNTDGITLQKMDVRSKEAEVALRFDASPACVVGNRIFYSGKEKDHYLYAYDITTGNVSVIYEGNVWAPEFQDGYIYYMNIDDNYCLYRYNLSSADNEKLTDDRCDAYICCDGYIVYQKNSKTDPQLMVMNADGSSKSELAKGNYGIQGTANGNVYFTEFSLPVPVYKYNVASGSTQIFQAAEDAANKHNKK